MWAHNFISGIKWKSESFRVKSKKLGFLFIQLFEQRRNVSNIWKWQNMGLKCLNCFFRRFSFVFEFVYVRRYNLMHDSRLLFFYFWLRNKFFVNCSLIFVLVQNGKFTPCYPITMKRTDKLTFFVNRNSTIT